MNQDEANRAARLENLADNPLDQCRAEVKERFGDSPNVGELLEFCAVVMAANRSFEKQERALKDEIYQLKQEAQHHYLAANLHGDAHWVGMQRNTALEAEKQEIEGERLDLLSQESHNAIIDSRAKYPKEGDRFSNAEMAAYFGLQANTISTYLSRARKNGVLQSRIGEPLRADEFESFWQFVKAIPPRLKRRKRPKLDNNQ